MKRARPLSPEKAQEYVAWCADKYLSIRPRSLREMDLYLRRKLARREVAAEDAEALVNAAIDQMLEEGRLDDRAFARWYIAEKNYFKPRGRIRLRHELKIKGIEQDTIERVFEENDTSDLALLAQLLQTKFFTTPLDDEDAVKRLIAKLQRRGFAYADIKTAIEDYREKE